MLNSIARHHVCIELDSDLNLLLILLEDGHEGEAEAFVRQEGRRIAFATTAELDQDMNDRKYETTHIEPLHESLNGGPEWTPGANWV